KGLAYAGVKGPGKAYEKMMARRDLRAGKKGALEHVARLKLEDHRRKHPELHLAEATRRRRHPRPERTALEKAVTRGRDLVRKGRRVAQGVHDGLGKVHDVVEKGLSGAERMQSGLEKAIAVARQGAEVLGEDSEFGRYLTRVADRADRIQDHLETGIGVAQDFNRKVGATHDAVEKIPGVHKDGEPEPVTYLDGRRSRRKSPHDADTKGLGAQVAISGSGIAESTHPDIFETTRGIYAVRSKVESFGAALRDPDDPAQVAKVLAKAKKAKGDLQALKAKYRKDKAAQDFLTGGGLQD